jgi:6-phosphogluconate dehydrogenase
MVHNGIEYSEMQLLCEAYHLMKDGLGLSHEEMRGVFARWNRGVLQGYLMEITAEVLSCRDGKGRPLVETILDVAGQKGTGGWSSASSFELGVPLGSIGEAVYARFLSGFKEDRLKASGILRGPRKAMRLGRKGVLEDLRRGILASKVVSYSQGFMLMKAASERYGWGLDPAKIALLWQNGCILRNALLGRMRKAFTRKPGLPSLLLDPYFTSLLRASHSSLRRSVARAVGAGIPVPVFSSTLAFYDGYRTSRLPANLLQAQRDYFGAHTFERVDRPRGKFFHVNWKGGAGAGDSFPCEVQAVPGKRDGGG